MNLPNSSMATPITINAIPTSHARIWGAIKIATPNITNINAGMRSTSPDIGLSVIPLHIAAIGHDGAEVDSVISSSSKALGYAAICS